MEGGDKYDAGSDVEGFFPEEFRKYVRDRNLFCCYLIFRNTRRGKSKLRCWFFRPKHESDEADRYMADKFASSFSTYIYVPGQCLVQFWRAQEVTSIGDFGERRFRLTTRNQPFIFMTGNDETPFSEGICSYRMKMVDFITGDEGEGGVIGRVFRNNRMECTPNIGYYSYEEHSHRDLALSCHIKSSVAFPLSNSSGRSIGVLEIVSSESNLVALHFYGRILQDFSGYSDCCKDICKQYDSLEMAVSEIEKVKKLVSRSCCLSTVQTWMMCDRCSCLSPCECFGYDLYTVKKGEEIVGKAVTSSHNLVYCDDVSQFSITEYSRAHFARYHKLTARFATCLRSYHTGNLIYVLEFFFLNTSEVNGRGPRAMLVPILEGMRKNFRTFKLASGEEIGGNLSVQVIDAGSPDQVEIFEIGKLDSKLPPRNGIDISLDELEKVSGMKRKDAAKMLNVSVSTFKRVCRDYQISRWPPRKKNLDQFCSGNSDQIGSVKELRGSAPAPPNENLVTIKVSMRLELEAGSYVVKYQDDENDWILVRCDDDLWDYISSSASLGKTTLTMLLEHI